jgi:hypothetical protein
MTLPPCFNFSHDRSSPLHKEEQYICQAINQIATENKDFACIAGSFPLVQLLRQNSLPTFSQGMWIYLLQLSLPDENFQKL